MTRPLGRFSGVAAGALLLASLSACSHNKAEIRVFVINAPAMLTINQSVNLTASVANDESSAGVDWTVSAGTIAPAHTASGSPTVFTAPAAPGPVTVTATSTKDGSTKATANITVVPIGSNGMLHGTYVFSVGGTTSSGTYAAAGVLIADGNGNITGGEQDYADKTLRAGPDPVTGTYAIGPDGRGSITLSVDNANLPNNGLETFGFALTSSTHALVIQFDGTATSSGALEAQSASALEPSSISGAYAFTAQGLDIVSQVPLAHGGVLAVDAAAGTVTGGAYYVNDGGSTYSSAVTGSITVPDAFGRGTLTLSVDATFIYYAVQGQVLRLIESDYPYVVAGGLMAGQGAAGAAGTFGNASLAGSYVISAAGGSNYGPLALAGEFEADGTGAFSSGVTDVNHAGVATFAPVTGSTRYAITANGVGTLSLPRSVDQAAGISTFLIFMVSPDINLIDPTSPSGGGGALIMDYDVGAIGAGSIVPRSAATFAGNYAVNLQYATSTAESDWIGQAVAAGGILTGTVDVNDNGLIAAGLPLTGTFASDANNPGRFTGTLNANSTAHTVVFYQVNDKTLVIADMGATTVGIGLLGKQ